MTAPPKLRPDDLRNPMWHLLNSESKGQLVRRDTAAAPGARPSPRRSPNNDNSASRRGGKSALRLQRTKRNFLPESVCHRVEKSWQLVSDNLQDLGIDFLLRVFDDSPELLSLLPYGRSYLDAPPEDRADMLRRCPALRVHSVNVMTAVGNCVAGLDNVESLVPSLRSLGKTHRMAGIEDGHYKKLFGHLAAAIRDRIGPARWDDETAEAWELVYFSLASIMSRPVTPLEAEPVTGWHELLVFASLYVVVATPYRLAGFSARAPAVEAIFYVLDAMALALFVADLCSSRIVDSLKVKHSAVESAQKKGPRREGPLRLRFKGAWLSLLIYGRRAVRSLQMDQWVSWPLTDKLAIASFALQYSVHFVPQWHKYLLAAPSASAGVHWVHVFGLLWLVAVTRVVHALRCTENNILLRRRVDQKERTMMRVAKLVLTLMYVTHLSACLWCIVARIQLGSGALDASAPTAFFPEPALLMGETGAINSYFRAMHWGWVNLAGIGNVDSTPVTTLECITTLLVHVCGVTLYAIMTGNVVAVLEELTSKENAMGKDLEDLGAFMMDCGVPLDVQERIMHGYLMRNMIAKDVGRKEEEGCDDMLEGSAAVPSIDNEVLGRLPRHLQHELKVYSRAEALQRRDKTFRDCSADFLFALSGELKGSTMLLPGDYLLKDGKSPQQVLVLDSGTMEIEANGKTIKILRKGYLLGKQWLLQDLNEKRAVSTEQPHELGGEPFRIVQHVPTAHSFSEWLDFGEGVDNVKVRAMTDCRLATGLSSSFDVQALRKRFPGDFEALKKDRERVFAAVHKVGVTRNIIRAQIAFKQKLRHSPSV